MNKLRKFSILVVFFLFFLIFLVLTPTTQAYEYKGGEKVVVESGEVIKDDLYVGANIVEIKGTVKGDLVAFGTTITISPEAVIEGDFIAAGQSIVTGGKIKDDVRIAGFALSLDEGSSIEDDFIGAGYSFQMDKGSQVGGDLIFWGAQAIVEGDIAGDLTANVGGLVLNSVIGGNVLTEVGGSDDVAPVTPFKFMPDMPPVEKIPGGLTIGQDTQITGDLTYTAPQEEEIPSWAVSGEILYKQPLITANARISQVEKTTAEIAGFWLLRLIRRYVSLLLVGLLILRLVPNLVEQSAARLQVKPWGSLGWGVIVYSGFYFLILLVLFVAILIAVIFGMLTLSALSWLTIGSGITIILNLVIVFIISVAFLSKILTAYLGGRLILERFKPEWSLKMMRSFILGGLLVAFLITLPFIGWIFNLVVTFLGLGAIFFLIKDRIFQPETAPVDKKGDA